MCATGAENVTTLVKQVQEWEKDARQAVLAAIWEIWATGQHALQRAQQANLLLGRSVPFRKLPFCIASSRLFEIILAYPAGPSLA